jgi:SAM-dependent methyltransferase
MAEGIDFAAHRSLFNTLAADYADGRPNYPAELFDRLVELSGRPLAGAWIADVGAGTGISSRQLAERGARVVAVEPSAQMLGQLLASSPGVTGLRGDGNALPFADGTLDFVTYAQSWHWTDPSKSVPEFQRVLRPGGAFAAWWNFTDRDSDWSAAQERRIAAVSPNYVRETAGARLRHERDVFDTGAGLLAGKVAEFAWSRRVSVDTHIRLLTSKSYIGNLDRAVRDDFLSAERNELRQVFPDGQVLEEYRTYLAVVPA